MWLSRGVRRRVHAVRRRVVSGSAAVITGAVLFAVPVPASQGAAATPPAPGVLSAGGYTMAAAAAPRQVRVVFIAPDPLHAITRLVIISDTKLTLSDGYHLETGSAPGDCGDPSTDGADFTQLCNLIPTATFIVSGTSKGEFIQVDCSGQPNTANPCPTGVQVQAGGGDDLIVSKHTFDTSGTKISCGPGDDSVTELGPADRAAPDCEQVHGEPDSDQDGVVDIAEDAMGTDKSNPDTDSDFLNDGQELQLGTDPLDRDSDHGGVRDDREVLIDHTNPKEASDDLPMDYEVYWHGLVDTAAADYKLAKSFGGATKGYYHQILNLVCSAAGVSKARPAGASAMKSCAAMRAAVGPDYGTWAGDFPYEVFRSFLPTVDRSEIQATKKKALILGHSMCAAAAGALGPVAGVDCERHLDDIGFSVAGTLHATHHLYPNFVKYAERVTASADGGTHLQIGILTRNVEVMRRQHHALFAKAVVPGFEAVNEVSGVYKWIAQKFVPFAASCERENAIRDAMRKTLGKAKGDRTYASTDPHNQGDIVTAKKCRVWMKASHLI